MLWSCVLVFLFKQKTAYEMRISDWSSDVCSSDLVPYTAAFRDRVGEVFARRSIDLERLCLLNPFVAQVHSDMILAALDEWHRPAETIDLIASQDRKSVG